MAIRLCKITYLFLLLAAAASAFGCAVGNDHHYADVVLDLELSGEESVTVATHDRRPYVVSGDKPTHFVGLSRGDMAIPSTSGPPRTYPSPMR